MLGSKYPVFIPDERTSNRDVFHAVVEHLRAQGGPAWDGRGRECVNRTEDGRACAVACLLDDAEAAASSAWLALDTKTRQSHPRLGQFDTLLGALQRAHDEAARDEAHREGSGLATINRKLDEIARVLDIWGVPPPLTRWELPAIRHSTTTSSTN
jgi:hypothetical protein